MRLFRKKDSRPDQRTISIWIGSIQNRAEKGAFHTFRKQSQNALFSEAGATLLGDLNEHNGEIAFLLVHLLSGRCSIPSVREVLREVNPTNFKEAEDTIAGFDSTVASSLSAKAMLSCSIEVTNETLEGHYEEALTIANFGVQRWPDVAELWRQRGVLSLALGRYSEAVDDLGHARSMDPQLLQLDEPLACAKRLLG